jgi:hypothetical protein
MCWQHSRTYSWHVARCYAVRDWGIGMPMEGKVAPLGQVSAPETVKPGQSSLKSPKIVQFEQIAALGSLSGLVAQRFPKSMGA